MARPQFLPIQLLLIRIIVLNLQLLQHRPQAVEKQVIQLIIKFRDESLISGFFGTGAGASPNYASPTQSSTRRSAGVGAPASPQNNVRIQPSQRNGSHSSRPRPGHHRRRQANGSDDTRPSMQLIQCPLCSRSFEKHVIEVHAANCEGRPEDIPEVVTIGDDEIPQSSSNISKVECPICNQAYDRKDIEQHASVCGEEVYV